MADELNTPDHRWYQKRYNIPLAKEDFSKQWIYDSGIQKINAWIALLGGVSAYAINTYDPSLVFDFGEDYFRTSGSTSTFSDSITHSATTNATMVDSDGLLKWRPHNLLTYSEDISQWTAVNATFEQSGAEFTITDDATNDGHYFYRDISSPLIAINQTVEVDLKAGTGQFAYFSTWNTGSGARYYAAIIDLNTGNVAKEEKGGSGFIGLVEATTVLDLGDGWYRCKFVVKHFIAGTQRVHVGVSNSGTPTIEGDGTVNYTGSGDTIQFRYPRQYRSDLGGMVDNPDRGDSYVPTTTSAVYLPRRGHHVYNGSAWVNEGLLHESELRVNLLTYSSEFDNAAWTKTQCSVANTVAVTDPSGGTSAELVTATAGTTTKFLRQNLAVPSTVTFSVYLKSDTQRYIQLVSDGDVEAYANFDILAGAGQIGTKGTKTTSSIVDVGNGWYRCSATFASATAGVSARVFFVDSSSAAWFASSTTTGAYYIWGAQLEAGSTPSSYIPTNGQQVTRAAETLTVPAANLPWPSPVVIGEELVTNGTFDTDTSGWTDSSTGASTFTWNAGAAELFKATGEVAAFYALLTLSSGSVYKLSWTGSGVGGTVRVGTTPNGQDIVSISSSKEIFFKATGNHYLQFNCGTNNGTAIFDNISVREINPLSVSIQMQGRMTYADEGTSNQLRLFDWGGGSSIITDRIRTDSSYEGGFWINQVASGVSEVVSQIAPGSYSPGVNVPFNIASRHGSTFVNGAVDGVALTADQTPTVLPNLQASDFLLANDYMGTIKLFRMWSDDLADAGIAEATLPSLEPSLSLTFDGSETSFTVDDWSE
jgi:hypothetical protein